MNPTNKKFISLFLVFSLLVLSGNLFAKKRGAELTIQKKDGHLIRGELIAVKEHSLLLLSATDVSIDIADIKVIRIAKNSKALLGAGIGLLIARIHGNIILGSFSILIGLGIGAGLGKDKTIQIEGMTDSEIQETLEKLRKKARIRDYK